MDRTEVSFRESLVDMGSSHTIPLQAVEKQIRLKTRGKGRQADPRAILEVARILGGAPREMNLPTAEDYEVASTCHHFR